jgi:hypothetical protein
MKKKSVLVLFMAVCVFTMLGNIGNVSAVNKCEVKFSFDGLQALAFGNPTRVTDGLLEAHHHTAQIVIKRIEKNREQLINKIEGKSLNKKILNVSVPNKQLEPVRYFSSDMNKDKQDFRWCLDIESDLFQKQLYLKDNFMTKIRFNTGTFYAENITEGKYQFVAGSILHSFNRQIGRPTLKVELSQNESLIISGLDEEIKLPYKAGVSYSIAINNLPPQDMMDINHFSFYYDSIKTNVPRFMPMLVQKVSFIPHPIVCEAAIFGKSSID